jgi:hypothetical protein
MTSQAMDMANRLARDTMAGYYASRNGSIKLLILLSLSAKSDYPSLSAIGKGIITL